MIYDLMSYNCGVVLIFCSHSTAFRNAEVAHSGFGSEVGTPMASGCVTPVHLAPVGQAITLVPMGFLTSVGGGLWTFGDVVGDGNFLPMGKLWGLFHKPYGNKDPRNLKQPGFNGKAGRFVFAWLS